MNGNLLILLIIVIGFLFFLKTEREYDVKHKDRVTDYLPWSYLRDDGTIVNKNRSLTKILKFKGRDLATSSDEELVILRLDLNNILKRMDEGYVLHVEARREKVREYPKSTFKEKIYEFMNKSREKNNLSGNYYETNYYISVTYFLPKENMNKLGEIYTNEKVNKEQMSQMIEKFENDFERVFLLFKETLLEIKKLDMDETATFLHGCISNKNHYVKAQQGMYLDSYISDTEIFPGLDTKVGDKYLGIVSLLSFPTETFCGMLNEFNKLDVEYRWVSRFIYISNENAIDLARKYEAKSKGRAKSAGTAYLDQATNTNVNSADREKLDRGQEASDLQYDLKSEELKAGYYTFTLILKNENKEILKEQLEKIITILNAKGFVATVDRINGLEAFFGTMPGDVEHNIRKPIITTPNLLDLLPLSSDWNGDKINKHVGQEALLFCESGESTSFKLNNHVGDVGHTMILGPTGYGKSVLLLTLAYQCRKYDAQVIIFDKGGSSRVFTEAGGGKFYDIGEEPIQFQPLRDIDKESELEWAYEWLCDLFEMERVNVNNTHKNIILQALKIVSNNPKELRTMSQLKLQLQSQELRDVLVKYTNDPDNGLYGNYFDNEVDSLTSEHAIQVFEMEHIFNSKMLQPLLNYLFHKLEVMMFNGKLTYLFLDECWLMLDNERFAGKIREWVKVLRKKNVSVIFATQSLKDVEKSKIKDALIESCPSKIFLPNPYAFTEYRDLYIAFGLQDKTIDMLSTAKKKKDYLYKGEFEKFFQLNLTPLELAYVGSSTPEEQEMCKKIKKEVSNLENPVEEFNRKWLQYKNISIDEEWS